MDNLQENLHAIARDLICQVEEENLDNVLEIRVNYGRKIREAKIETQKLENKLVMAQRELDNMMNKIQDKNQEIKNLLDEQTNLKAILASLEGDFASLKKQIQKMNYNLQKGEKNLGTLKEKKENLQGIRLNLEARIADLKEQTGPLENEIEMLTEKECRMQMQLYHYYKINTHLKLKIAELGRKIKITERDIEEGKQKVKHLNDLMCSFRIDLYNCMGLLEEPQALKDTVQNMYKRYAQSDKKEKIGADKKIHMECGRQRNILEKNVVLLKKRLINDEKTQQTEKFKMLNENAFLITEINNLREALKTARAKAQEYETQLGLDKKKICKIPASQKAKPTTYVNIRPTAFVQHLKIQSPKIQEESGVLPPLDMSTNNKQSTLQ